MDGDSDRNRWLLFIFSHHDDFPSLPLRPAYPTRLLRSPLWCSSQHHPPQYPPQYSSTLLSKHGGCGPVVCLAFAHISALPSTSLLPSHPPTSVPPCLKRARSPRLRNTKMAKPTNQGPQARLLNAKGAILSSKSWLHKPSAISSSPLSAVPSSALSTVHSSLHGNQYLRGGVDCRKAWDLLNNVYHEHRVASPCRYTAVRQRYTALLEAVPHTLLERQLQEEMGGLLERYEEQKAELLAMQSSMVLKMCTPNKRVKVDFPRLLQ
ncbi:hypothetical protein C8F01DRAFT_1267366 [Mycena amicta]|nr:hypothetical protein C8F01DRAFT_1267366 [Mycena amicta]